MGILFKNSVQQTSAISVDQLPNGELEGVNMSELEKIHGTKNTGMEHFTNVMFEDVEYVIMSDPKYRGTKNTGMAEVSQQSELPSIENDAPRKGFKRPNSSNSLEDDRFEKIKEIMSYGCPSFDSFYSKVRFQSRAEIKKLLSFLKRDSSKTCEEVLNTLEEYETLQKSIQDDLLKWEKCDRLTGIGYDFNSGDEILKEIRKRFQDLNSILDKIKKNLEELPSDEEKKAKKEKIEEKIDSLSNELLNSAFVVKNQSQQQVYRIDCNVSKRINGLMVVNLLGGRLRQERPSSVKASIVVGTHVNDLDTLREYEIGSTKWIYSGFEANADFTKSKIEIKAEQIRKLRRLGTGDARHPEERF